jgi:hypothetical protein
MQGILSAYQCLLILNICMASSQTGFAHHFLSAPHKVVSYRKPSNVSKHISRSIAIVDHALLAYIHVDPSAEGPAAEAPFLIAVMLRA